MEKKKKRKWLRRVIIVLLLIIALAGIAFAVLQTGWAKARIANYIAKKLSSATNSNADVGKISGFLPFNIKVDNIGLSDDTGGWFRIEKLKIDLSPFSLLSGKININSIDVKSIRLTGKPPERVPSEKSVPVSAPSDWRERIPRIAVRQIKIDELFLGGNIIGEDASFSIKGSISALDPVSSIECSLSIEGRDSFAGSAEIQVSISGETPSFSVEGSVNEPSGIRLAEILKRPSSGEVSVKFAGKGTLESLSVILDAKAEGIGNIALDTQISLGPGDIGLSLPNPEAEGTFRLMYIHEGNEISAQGSYELREGRAVLPEFSAEGMDVFVKGNATVPLSGFNADDFDFKGSVNIEGDITQVAGLILPEGNLLRGIFSGNIEISRGLRSPDVEGGFVLEGIEYSESSREKIIQDAYISSSFRLSDGILTVPEFIIRNGKNVLEGKVSIGLGDDILSPVPGDVEANLSGNIKLSSIPSIPKEHKVDGLAYFVFNASGSYLEPVVSGLITLDETSYTLNDRDFANNLASRIEFAFRDGNLSFPVIAIRHNGTEIDADFMIHVGRNPWEFERSGEISGSVATEISLAEIAELFPDYQGINGILSGRAQVSGNMDNPEIEGSIEAFNGEYSIPDSAIDIKGINANASFSLKDRVFSIPHFSGSGSGLQADGNIMLATGDESLSFSPDTTISAILSVNADVAGLLQVIMPERNFFKGDISVDIEAGGSIASPGAEIMIRLLNGEYIDEITNREIKGISLNADVVYAGGILDLKSFTANAPGTNLTANLNLALGDKHAEWRDDPEMSGSFSGHFDVGTVSAFFLPPRNIMTGSADANLNVTGSFSNPHITGTATLDNGSYENLLSGTVLRNIKAVVEAGDNRFELKELTATDGESGTVIGTGWLEVDFARKNPFDISIELRNATLARLPVLTGAFNGTAGLSGTFEEMKLEGRITAGGIEARLPERVPAAVRTIEVIQVGLPGMEETQEASPGFPPSLNVGLDVELLIPSRLFVRGHGLDSEWKGDLSLKGDHANPSIAGRLSIVRGTLDFSDKRFNLAEGAIIFDGAVPPRPAIDVRAEARAGDITAVIALSGPITAPVLTIDSIPSLPSNEILSRVLFGKSASEITPLQALRLTNTLRSLAGGSDAFSFLNRTREIMNLDRLQLEQSGDDAMDAGVAAGKYLREDIYIELQKKITGAGGGISVEKIITPRISVESEVDSKGDSGFRIKWKWDY